VHRLLRRVRQISTSQMLRDKKIKRWWNCYNIRKALYWAIKHRQHMINIRTIALESAPWTLSDQLSGPLGFEKSKIANCATASSSRDANCPTADPKRCDIKQLLLTCKPPGLPPIDGASEIGMANSFPQQGCGRDRHGHPTPAARLFRKFKRSEESAQRTLYSEPFVERK
jgi:hypothetical protein